MSDWDNFGSSEWWGSASARLRGEAQRKRGGGGRRKRHAGGRGAQGLGISIPPQLKMRTGTRGKAKKIDKLEACVPGGGKLLKHKPRIKPFPVGAHAAEHVASKAGCVSSAWNCDESGCRPRTANTFYTQNNPSTAIRAIQCSKRVLPRPDGGEDLQLCLGEKVALRVPLESADAALKDWGDLCLCVGEQAQAAVNRAAKGRKAADGKPLRVKKPVTLSAGRVARACVSPELAKKMLKRGRLVGDKTAVRNLRKTLRRIAEGK